LEVQIVKLVFKN